MLLDDPSLGVVCDSATWRIADSHELPDPGRVGAGIPRGADSEYTDENSGGIQAAPTRAGRAG